MKVLSGVVLAVLTFAILTAGPLYAGTVYSNARGDFVSTDPADPDAGGVAVVNYAKGAEKWIVSGEVWKLRPDTTYKVTLGKGGVWTNNFVASFTTDASGAASFHEQATYIHGIADYNIIRIWYQSGKPYLVANEPLGPPYSPETHGVLSFQGQQRGQ